MENLRELLPTSQAKWLVTGAAGFIGSNLVETLLQLGQDVVGLDNFSTGYQANLDDAVARASGPGAGRFEFIRGDIRDLETCKRACRGVRLVLHQAALGSVPRSIADPITTHDVNTNGFLNMLVAARDERVQRFVYASSSSVYGDHPGLPKTEAHVGTPLSPYAVTKRVCEMYAHTFQQHFGLEVIGLRYFNVFGRRQDPNGAYAAVMPKWFALLLDGKRCTIYGDGETSRDFCYISNVVQVNLRAAFAAASATQAVYNVAYGQRTTLRELYAAIVDNLRELRPAQAFPDVDYAPFRQGDIRHSLADISAARTQLDYAPTHSVSRGLNETAAWYARRATQDSE